MLKTTAQVSTVKFLGPVHSLNAKLSTFTPTFHFLDGQAYSPIDHYNFTHFPGWSFREGQHA